MWTEARTDNKLRLLADDEHRVWFDLLCYAAEQRGAGRGTFDATDLDFLAVEAARADRALLERTLAQLQRLRIVAITPEGQGLFTHWAVRQYDKPSALPEHVRERVAAHRERQRDATAAAGNPLSTGGNAEQRPVTPGNAAVTPSNTLEERRGEERRSEGGWERVQGEPNGTVAPAPPAATSPAAVSPPAVPKPNKLAELTDLIRTAGLPYEPTPADGKALKTTRLSAAQVAACYLAVACGEFGDDWQRDHLCAATAIGAYNAWQTARQVPPVPRASAANRNAKGRTTMVDHIAARLAAIQTTAQEDPEHGRHTVIDVFDISPRDGPTDGQLSPARRLPS